MELFILTFLVQSFLISIIANKADSYVKLQVPDNRVPLSVSDVGVVCEQDSVVRHHRLARGKNATWNVAHTVQNAVIHQEVIYQQLIRQRMSAEGNKV